LPLGARTIVELLQGPARAWPTGIATSLWEIRGGLHLWLVAHEPGLCTLWGDARVPDLFGLPDRVGARAALCLMDATSLVLLARPQQSAREGELVIVVPRGGVHLAERLQRTLDEWHAAGRPTDADLQIRAYPRGEAPSPQPGEIKLDRRWTHFVLRWVRLV
jgi:protein-L-isoaspartate(D-aspartate) O-methyltransferase